MQFFLPGRCVMQWRAPMGVFARRFSLRPDPLVNLDYCDSIQCASLCHKHCYRLAGLGHAPFWEDPGEFNPLLERFLADVESGRAFGPRYDFNKSKEMNDAV
jgi:pimeloyl-ACP methyl ester carboxylesterase